jgi:hypothetical protein
LQLKKRRKKKKVFAYYSKGKFKFLELGAPKNQHNLFGSWFKTQNKPKSLILQKIPHFLVFQPSSIF